MLRAVALLCLSSGAALDAATGPSKGKGGDEQTLLRALLDHLAPDDVLLGDAFFPTYFLLYELQRRGVDGLFELSDTPSRPASVGSSAAAVRMPPPLCTRYLKIKRLIP